MTNWWRTDEELVKNWWGQVQFPHDKILPLLFSSICTNFHVKFMQKSQHLLSCKTSGETEKKSNIMNQIMKVIWLDPEGYFVSNKVISNPEGYKGQRLSVWILKVIWRFYEMVGIELLGLLKTKSIFILTYSGDWDNVRSCNIPTDSRRCNFQG